MRRSMCGSMLIAFSVFLTTSCGKKKEEYKTPPIETMTAEITLNIPLYKHTYTRSSDSTFDLTALDATVILKRTGSFFDEEYFSVPDTSTPDTTQNEYDRILFPGGDTIIQQFNAPVAGKLTYAEVKSGVTYSVGDNNFIHTNNKAVFSHTEEGLEELKSLYMNQLETEYHTMVSDMMWAEIERQAQHRYSKEEMKERYKLNLKSRYSVSKIPESLFEFSNDTIKLSYAGTFIFVQQFTGDVEILK